jgi:uncharacterized protein YndB with AHSA1/START domain
MTATQVRESTREIACTRVYKAPKELLIRMWANPEHITNWWGPVGFTTSTHAMEFKTNGLWQFTMHGPDGTDYPSLVRYTHISPDRIEYEHFGSGAIDFTARVEFRELGNSTEMNFRMTFVTAELRRLVAEKYGAVQGQIDTVTRLGEYAAKQDPKAIELVIVRQFDSPQERVWKALTEPEQMQKWQCPIGLDLETSGDGVHVGGKWNIVMSNSSGFREEASGEYLSVDPISSLETTHRWKKHDGTFKPTTRLAYNLHSHEGKTTLTFVQTGFWSEEARAAHLIGWDSCLFNLAILLAATKADRQLSLVREFDAPIALVWKCWTEPERIREWFAPQPYTSPQCEIDFRPGGKFVLVMRSPDGDEHAMSAIIADIEPLSTIGWVFSVPDSSGGIAIAGGTFITFADLGGRTRVSVNTYAAAYTDGGTAMVRGMELGWNMTLDQMVAIALQLTKETN